MALFSKRYSWVRRRWLDFRQGHSIYLVFLMTFANFITIQYSLMVHNIPIIGSTFGSVWLFALTFVAFYTPLAIVIGYWHRRSQWKIEQQAMFNENVVQARLYLFLIKLIEGKTTEKERQDMKDMLSKIVRKSPSKEPDSVA